MSGQITETDNHHQHQDVDSEGEDEFVVIHEGRHHQEVEEDLNESFVDAPPVLYAEKSGPASISSGPIADLADIGVGSSTPPSAAMTESVMTATQAGSIMGSFYHPFGSNSVSDTSQQQMEKLVDVIKEEQEKNGAMLTSIMETVSELVKEKTHNGDLKAKALDQEKQLQAAKVTILEMDSTLSQFKARLNADTEQRTALMEALNKEREENIEKAMHLANLQEQFVNLKLENSHLKSAMDQMAQKFEASQVEVANQAEIINVLQSESSENNRFHEEKTKVYRERLNNLEAQVASYYERNEVEPRSLEEKKQLASAEFVLRHTLNNNNSTDHVTSGSGGSPPIFLCDRCFTAFPQYGFYVTHRSIPKGCNQQ